MKIQTLIFVIFMSFSSLVHALVVRLEANIDPLTVKVGTVINFEVYADTLISDLPWRFEPTSVDTVMVGSNWSCLPRGGCPIGAPSKIQNGSIFGKTTQAATTFYRVSFDADDLAVYSEGTFKLGAFSLTALTTGHSSKVTWVLISFFDGTRVRTRYSEDFTAIDVVDPVQATIAPSIALIAVGLVSLLGFGRRH